MSRSFLRRGTWICIIGILIVSILPNISPDYWLFDILSNFKLQYLIISVLLLIISSLTLQHKVLAIGFIVISILWNCYYIVPYYLTPPKLISKSNFKISSLNLLSSNTKINLVKSYIEKEDPDILVLMEFTPEWESLIMPIQKNYPYKKFVARADNFGIALLSKFEMNSSIDYFELNNKPSIRAELKIENECFTLIATHPMPPMSQSAFENRNKQLLNIVDKRSNFSENLIVVGDFNTSSFSNHFRALVEGNLKDSRIGFGLLPTWPASFGVLQTTLDHCLVSKNLIVLDRSVGENIGSDHLPISIGTN
ncbi:exonuclease/endonuclease/phosphatase superfamily protein [Psychroflexus torquis ATCC 700755]|uniref:Exonuclease/endonuclease/phosphatase superfamily protein n=1 Tax=Psychroflexus torquis (strain ATCC 700755 / CIP 106069 / ACAM 623) TaxID=313595 RepID=K4IK73_PSYTT|nr:endonuclease/exonuclease/phosphatase family protein [Psychroflexus torquis]AFU69471.1 exonuclease/endonuclease/phosphatase superfamily protein [Psychroflexus torquis ATCC 700755]